MKKHIKKIAGALINDRKELLIVRKKKSEIYINPGGRVEEGEEYIDTLRRELEEELQINLLKADFFNSYYSKRAVHDPDCELTISVYIVKWEGEIIPSAEIFQANWLSKDDYKNNKYQLSPQLVNQIIPDLIKADLVDLK